MLMRTLLKLSVTRNRWADAIAKSYQKTIGEKGRRIRELTSLVQKRFNFAEDTVELYAERVQNRALCAIAMAESLRYKLLGGLPVRRACSGVLRYVMENGIFLFLFDPSVLVLYFYSPACRFSY